MFALYGTVCHICGHGEAYEADHLDPVALDPHQPVSPFRMRPSHGTSAPCPVCVGRDGTPRKCNQERGARPLPGPLRTSEDW